MISLNKRQLDTLFVDSSLQIVSKGHFGFIENDCDFVKSSIISIICVGRSYIGSLDEEHQNKMFSLINNIVYG